MSQLLLAATSIVKIVKVHSLALNAALNALEEMEQQRPLRLVRARAQTASGKLRLRVLG